MTPFNRYRDAAIVVVLLAVPFFVLRSNMKKPDSQTAVDRFVVRVTSPVQYGAASLGRGVSNLWGDYVYLVDVKEDNARLAYENARLKESVHRLEENETENQNLKRLLQLRESTPGESVSALVTIKDFNEFFRTTRLVLDRGSRDIRPFQPVISPDGVVGLVLKVSGDQVDVQLAVDAGFGIDVEDDRTKARGFVRGTGDPSRHSCRMDYVDSRDEVNVGDLLVTSGKGKRFPHGYAIARVTKVIKRELGRDQEIEAMPTVDFTRLDSALILITPPGDDQTAEAHPPTKGK